MTDIHRPQYHFLPPKDWMNDPKLFFWKGEYHVFFQYSVDPEWKLRLWGHAVSTDLVRWRSLPVALEPTPGGPDEGGCWTGCVVEDGGMFKILYTGVSPQSQCLASSKDLVHWEKHAGNPVVRPGDKPPGFGDCFRDPCVWREGGAWQMLIGSEKPGSGGAALLYESQDLVHWRYVHAFCMGRLQESGRMFECPDFFPLGGRHVLLTSCGRTYWHSGRYAGRKLSVDKVGPTDGGAFYAAKTLLDDRGRRILFGWVRETRSRSEQLAAGWSGVLSLPRALAMSADNSVEIEPVPELRALRGKHWSFNNLDITAAPLLKIPEGVRGRALEIIVKFAPSSAMEFGIAVLVSPDAAEYEKITWTRDIKALMGSPLALAPDEGLELHVFLDHSVIEAFANGRACYTARAYPARGDRDGVGIYCAGGTAKAESVEIWELT